MGTQIAAVDGVVKGTTYGLKVRARNIYGFGPYSSTVLVVASSIPGEPNIVTTQTQGTNALITF